MRGPIIEKIDVGSLELKDQVVSINRVTKVVKGGKNLSFSALVVVGDGNGHVGYGMGKAREVSSAIKKGVEAAKKNVVKVPITEKGSTIPHTVTGHFGSGAVLLKPASEGTGVIAGGAVRAVITAAGIQNILTKSLGSTTAHNVVKATVDALTRLKQPERVARLRGKSVSEVTGHRGEEAAPSAAPAPPVAASPARLDETDDQEGEGGREDQGQDDRQRHRLPGQAAGHRARPGPAPDAPGGGARGHADDPGNGQQGLPPRVRGRVTEPEEQWHFTI